MSAIILDGRKIAETILARLREKVNLFEAKPRLGIVVCGNNPESRLYARLKEKKSKEVGILATVCSLPTKTKEEALIKKIKELNASVDGIIVQLPLPSKFDTRKVLDSIDTAKDVDGLTSSTMGHLLMGDETLAPATPKGIVRLLNEYKIDTKGKDVVIVNNSNIVGKPLAMMLMQREATVTVCHKHTKDIKAHTKQADILVSGVGIPRFISKEMVKKGAVVIDVGVTKNGDKVVGDVDFERVKEKVAFISPVPGGVGPMTVAMVIENLISAKIAQTHRRDLS